ncbi:glycoside hydrolase superfamily [Lophiotrema nucula]|uniref:Glycoside hydrolase superfamily n=1 Tax=Lophiotrema nucula TaxID=690887 RepID=A0A6A5ZGE0_9PLEO|nr:glycoside hydrolase superfamily [Lophiotrema nucula]
MPHPSVSAFANSFFKPRQEATSPSQEAADYNSNGENRCIFQGFEWNIPADQKHWRRLENSLNSLKAVGVDEVWLPPGCKATHQNSNGYDIYDLYDLGEFDQKWHKVTKWGSKEDLLALSSKAEQLGVGLIWDTVLSHRAGGDQRERVKAVEVDAEDRNKVLSKPREIEAFLGFDFKMRGGQYSDLKLHAEHFNGTDHDATLQQQKPGVIYLTKRWCPNVDKSEKGNYDFLIFSNLDYTSPALAADTINWGSNFMPSTLGPALSGFRLDAARHFDWKFTRDFLSAIKKTHPNKQWTFLAEYWHGGHYSNIQSYLRNFPPELKVLAYDAPLLYKFRDASSHLQPSAPSKSLTRPARPLPPFDMRVLMKDTLVSALPNQAVTMVASHDTQPGQTCEAYISPDFKEAAYAITLLRQGGIPCVFFGDLYGLSPWEGRGAEPPIWKLPDLMLARKLFAYGRQNEYWDAPGCVGWTREGLDGERVPEGKEWMGEGCAVVVSNVHEGGRKKMFVGKKHAGATWTGLWDWETYKLQIDDEGLGDFAVGGAGANVYVRDVASGRNLFGQFDRDIYGKA